MFYWVVETRQFLKFSVFSVPTIISIESLSFIFKQTNSTWGAFPSVLYLQLCILFYWYKEAFLANIASVCIRVNNKLLTVQHSSWNTQLTYHEQNINTVDGLPSRKGEKKWTAHKLVSCHRLQKYHSHYTYIIVYRVIKLSQTASV